MEAPSKVGPSHLESAKSGAAWQRVRLDSLCINRSADLQAVPFSAEPIGCIERVEQQRLRTIRLGQKPGAAGGQGWWRSGERCGPGGDHDCTKYDARLLLPRENPHVASEAALPAPVADAALMRNPVLRLKWLVEKLALAPVILGMNAIPDRLNYFLVCIRRGCLK